MYEIELTFFSGEKIVRKMVKEFNIMSDSGRTDNKISITFMRYSNRLDNEIFRNVKMITVMPSVRGL